MDQARRICSSQTHDDSMRIGNSTERSRTVECQQTKTSVAIRGYNDTR